MASKKKKAAAAPAVKRPTWSLWKHRETGVIWFRSADYLRREYDYATRTYIENGRTLADLEELNPAEFEIRTSLKLANIFSNRSGASFEWKDLKTDQHYHMMLRDFEDLVTSVTLHQGLVAGRWKFRNRGGSIGIYLVEELSDDE